MEKISFKNWELIVDYEITKATYEKTPFGGSDTCGCNYCKNFADNKDSIYPDEIKRLFNELGIDYKKECEVWHYYHDELGYHCYSGWFHFKGSFQDKNYVCQTNEIDPIIDLVPMNENFSIGFSENNQLSFFENKETLVQVEFTAKTKWTIDKSLESY